MVGRSKQHSTSPNPADKYHPMNIKNAQKYFKKGIKKMSKKVQQLLTGDAQLNRLKKNQSKLKALAYFKQNLGV